MAVNQQPERSEATLLAAAMVVLGGPFLFDKLAALVLNLGLSPATILQAIPVLVIVAAAIVLLTDPGVRPQSSRAHSKEGHHEL